MDPNLKDLQKAYALKCIKGRSYRQGTKFRPWFPQRKSRWSVQLSHRSFGFLEKLFNLRWKKNHFGYLLTDHWHIQPVKMDGWMDRWINVQAKKFGNNCLICHVYLVSFNKFLFKMTQHIKLWKENYKWITGESLERMPAFSHGNRKQQRDQSAKLCISPHACLHTYTCKTNKVINEVMP